jgi:hypothetical protein
MKQILLVMSMCSVMLVADTFTDSTTGLIWQDDSAAKDTKMNWENAQHYCSELNLGGYSDWRLPAIKELQSIVDISRYEPAIKKGFSHVASDGYWSSSTYVSDTEYAWIVNFKDGDTYYSTKTNERYVRCVRGRQ